MPSSWIHFNVSLSLIGWKEMILFLLFGMQTNNTKNTRSGRSGISQRGVPTADGVCYKIALNQQNALCLPYETERDMWLLLMEVSCLLESKRADNSESSETFHRFQQLRFDKVYDITSLSRKLTVL